MAVADWAAAKAKARATVRRVVKRILGLNTGMD